MDGAALTPDRSRANPGERARCRVASTADGPKGLRRVAQPRLVW